MAGQIEFEEFEVGRLPQGAASAWSAVENLVGASYKPLIFIGKQIVRGTNYWFIAEQKFMNGQRRIVKLAVNEFNGISAIVPSSLEIIF